MYILCISKGTNLIIPKNIAHIDLSYWSNLDYISCYDDLYSSIVVDESNPIYDSRENCNGIIETSTNTLIFASKAFQFPSNIEIIGEKSFMFYNEKNLILPRTVKEIHDYAFEGSSNLESIILPYSLQYIGDCIFYECKNLKYVFFEGTKYQYTKISQNESSNIYFYSDSKPSEEGNFWHYVDNIPEPWVE